MKYIYKFSNGTIRNSEQSPSDSEKKSVNAGMLEVFRVSDKLVEYLVDGMWRVTSQAIPVAGPETPVEAADEAVAESVAEAATGSGTEPVDPSTAGWWPAQAGGPVEPDETADDDDDYDEDSDKEDN